jgi:hypothetical protein
MPVVADLAECAAVVGVVGVEAQGFKFTARQRMVVSDGGCISAGDAGPTVPIQYRLPKSADVCFVVAA